MIKQDTLFHIYRLSRDQCQSPIAIGSLSSPFWVCLKPFVYKTRTERIQKSTVYRKAPRVTDSRQVRILCLEFDISPHQSFSFQLVTCKCLLFTIWLCILHVDFAAVFLAHIADFSLYPFSITIMCMAVVLRSKLSEQLYAFYTGTIYDTFIFQL